MINNGLKLTPFNNTINKTSPYYPFKDLALLLKFTDTSLFFNVNNDEAHRNGTTLAVPLNVKVVGSGS